MLDLIHQIPLNSFCTKAKDSSSKYWELMLLGCYSISLIAVIFLKSSSIIFLSSNQPRQTSGTDSPDPEPERDLQELLYNSLATFMFYNDVIRALFFPFAPVHIQRHLTSVLLAFWDKYLFSDYLV